MTVSLVEDRLTFHFPNRSEVCQYDSWSFYRNQFNSCFGGAKGIDFLYMESDTTWLIEVKDYRVHQRTKTIDLANEVAMKVRDTLAGLIAAQMNANDQNERRIAKLALSKSRLSVVLHLEQPYKQSRLFPRVIDPANVSIKLKQLLRAVDAHPKVVNRKQLSPSMNWTVTG